ncbi:hypothetical protein MJO28_006325 [Puccinia striiformis f. sp. tritici]|uniref:Uncharacterized protein n=1 Tax=Puccinia striiformis f. sp. tritici TaxID=168172 RepID=A0ACC0EGR6_9BASI|nr:hypothetical protein MJO28_006325 [Puccinia striiformis f. sp. tritici]
MLKKLTICLSYDIVRVTLLYLGGVMKGSKNTPPFLVPNKMKKMNEEIPLMSKFFGVKCMVPPGPFPFNTLQIMRFLRVVKENDQARLLEAITDRLYEVIFENKVPVSKDMSEVFKSLSPDLMERARVEEYLSQSGDEKIKESVKQDAEQVVEEGGFGFPWLEITQPNGQQLTIFGSDRFEFLANWLGKEWKGPNPSVSNPRESRL